MSADRDHVQVADEALAHPTRGQRDHGLLPAGGVRVLPDGVGLGQVLQQQGPTPARGTGPRASGRPWRRARRAWASGLPRGSARRPSLCARGLRADRKYKQIPRPFPAEDTPEIPITRDHRLRQSRPTTRSGKLHRAKGFEARKPQKTLIPKGSTSDWGGVGGFRADQGNHTSKVSAQVYVVWRHGR